MEVVLYCVSLSLIVPTLTWNIDTRFPIIFSGPSDSYFGFSVALHDNSKGSFALVSATKANSTVPARRSLHQPGVLYKCDIVTEECKEVILERTANGPSSSVEPTLSYVSKEDDMWLGVSLDVQSTGEGYVLACGHLWRNRKNPDDYFVNGACYTIDREFRRNSYKALIPLTHRDKQTFPGVYYYSYAVAGMSAAFVEKNANESDVLIGAPGFYNWKGTVVSYSGNPRYSQSPVVPDPSNEEIDENAYIGYSVTSGKFLALGHLQFAAGAPRDSEQKGKVYVIDSQYRSESSVTILQHLLGEQIGEYFGACVLGVNINRDTYTDLFVGSPLYSLPGLGEEGKVYVYISNGELLVKHQEIMGLKKPKSRFGTTIASIGDVNQDGFLDVAIGAPYEDDHGAIYVYHGSKEGLQEKYKQRIAATDVHPNLSGFGMSISKGKDIDENKYPDIAVGCYASDNAVLLRTRPVVKVFGSINFDPPQININRSLCTWNANPVPCFNVTFCLEYDGNHVSDQIDLSAVLSSGRQREELKVRRYLLNGNQLTSHIRQQLTITKGKQHCYDNHAYVAGDFNDFITPIQMQLSFRLIHDVSTEKRFCNSCPMLHPDYPSTIVKTISFHTGCGEDGVCDSDLVLTVKVLGLSSDELIIVGQDNVITLSIELKNLKEPAYNTIVYINIPSDVQIINQDHCRNEQGSFALPSIVCKAGNPLKDGDVVKFRIKLDTSGISTEHEYLRIRVNATTASKESKPEDNIWIGEIPLKILADITIIGNPIISEIILDEKSLKVGEPTEIIHHYTVLKYLPAPINSVTVEFLIPTTTIDEDVNFLQLTSLEPNKGNLRVAVPATCDFTTTDELLNTSTTPVGVPSTATTPHRHTIQTPSPVRKRSVDSADGPYISSSSARQSGPSSERVLDCTTSICKKVTCSAGPFKDINLAASFRIYGSINITNLKALLDRRKNIKIVTEGRVRIKDRRGNIQPINHRPDEAKVLTTIQYPLQMTQVVEIWIIIVSILAGVLLLIIILVVMIKMGFFHRKEKEEMEKMMMRAELKECEPFMVADANHNSDIKPSDQNGS